MNNLKVMSEQMGEQQRHVVRLRGNRDWASRWVSSRGRVVRFRENQEIRVSLHWAQDRVREVNICEFRRR